MLIDPHHPLLIVISGPSGVGKDAVIRRMKDRYLPFHFVVTATTRSPRPNEEHGKDYFFLSKEAFLMMVKQNELLEYSKVYGDYKGIPRRQIHDAMQSGKDVIMRIDVQGAAKIRAIEPNSISIFILPENEQTLISRLKSRKTENSKSLKLRIAAAYKELKRKDEFDYCVINRDMTLDDTVDQIIRILQAEHCRATSRIIR